MPRRFRFFFFFHRRHSDRLIIHGDIDLRRIVGLIKESGFDGAETRLLSATRIGKEKPQEMPLVLDVVQ